MCFSSPLAEVTRAQGLGYSEEERLRIFISALEEGDLPGDEQTQAEIRATLSASRQSLDRGSGLESAKLEPWWEAALKLGVDRPVGAWFSSGSRVPDLLPVSRTKLTGRRRCGGSRRVRTRLAHCGSTSNDLDTTCLRLAAVTINQFPATGNATSDSPIGSWC